MDPCACASLRPFTTLKTAAVVRVSRYPDIRRSRSLGVTGELHSWVGMNKAAPPTKAAMLLWHITAVLRDPCCESNNQQLRARDVCPYRPDSTPFRHQGQVPQGLTYTCWFITALCMCRHADGRSVLLPNSVIHSGSKSPN